MDVKGVFGRALLELAKEYPFEKITVGAIVARSGLGRSTFYKHFLDKYDLANWVHNKIQEGSNREFLEADKSFRDNVVVCLKRFEDFAPFYRNALGEKHINSLNSGIHELTFKMLKERLGKEGYDASEAENDWLIRFFAQGSASFTLDWVLGKIDLTAEEVADLHLKAMPVEFLPYLH